MIQRAKAFASVGAALALSMGALAACGDREAESETPVAEAEVKTELPEEVVSDQQLQNTADAAAATASTPPASVPAGGTMGAPGTPPMSGAAAPAAPTTTPPTQ
ncbi:MAG TPA: hypothetical protein VF699_10635 [Caulobacteraceae bacterium]|jgi:hypothetical protein